MQPTYIPWMGYFGLIDSVDLFVFLDNVQFAKRSWQQRNQILSNSGPKMLTVPVSSKGKRDQKIFDVEILADNKFRQSHIQMITESYKKTEYFDEIADCLFPLIKNSSSKLMRLNIEIIKEICSYLGIKTPTLLASDTEAVGVQASLLCSICKELEATNYIAVEGSRHYLELSDDFERNNISVSYFAFEHPVYKQTSQDFHSHMSVIDLLFNEGRKAKQIIESGISGAN